ncbi:hypothetical protein ABE65_011515 [Fictibacillus phosphorivorans]|uniref:HTH cro/C1-type domain-containing protein n=1 Tax=Fictibacillus phosphorivorans TaxID=1221500 RepID=A0A168W1B9_9BACL|nr:helix-turn-helix domain-containing protein [Fictibacillus phosphorivorans]ANC77395.1 hypothetical protein ABE65_011515 [Fictibacillus phosphorivorans]
MKSWEKIRYFRKKSNISQNSLSEGICSVSYLSKIENGQNEPSEEILLLLGNRLGIDLSEIEQEDTSIEKIRLWFKYIFKRDILNANKLYTEIKDFNGHKIETTIRYKIIQSLHHLIIESQYSIVEENVRELNLSNEILKETDLFYLSLVKGVYHYYKENYSDSYTYFKKAEQHISKVELQSWEKGYLYYLLALAANKLWKNLICLEYTRAALNIFEELYEFKRCADCRILSGIINQRIENWKEATKQLELAETIADSFSDDKLKGKIYHNLGYIEARKGNSQAAIDLFRKSLVHKEGLDTAVQVTTLYSLIEFNYKFGNFEEGKKLLERGIKLVKKNESLQDYYYLFTFYSNVYTYGIDHDITAEHLLKQVVPFFERTNKWVYLSEFYPILGKYFDKKSKYKQSSSYYYLANKAFKKIAQLEGYFLID